MKKLLVIGMLVLFVSASMNAQKKSPFKTLNDSVSYALGVSLYQSAEQFPMEMNYKMLLKGIKESADEKGKMNKEDAMSVVQDAFMKLQEIEKEKAAKESVEFLEKNKAEEGVIETKTGLQYKVITQGDGAVPTIESTVRVHYTGKLIDGTVFDSSVERGEPAEFGVTQVIPGWTEVLQIMPVGSEYKVFIPSDLAYGERGAGEDIKPGTTLIFDIQLLDIVE